MSASAAYAVTTASERHDDDAHVCVIEDATQNQEVQAAALSPFGDDLDRDKEKLVNLVTSHAQVSREVAVQALRSNNWDVVITIMELTL